MLDIALIIQQTFIRKRLLLRCQTHYITQISSVPISQSGFSV
nr:MAG TPA: hypothetical protein [Caudoviricetes sp.]